MREEFDELAEIALHADPRGPDPLPTSPVARQRLEEELGDVLFVVANVARHLGIDPEAALRATNEQVRRRFRYIEEALAARGTRAEDSTLAEMDALWDEAKARERGYSGSPEERARTATSGVRMCSRRTPNPIRRAGRRFSPWNARQEPEEPGAAPARSAPGLARSRGFARGPGGAASPSSAIRVASAPP